MTQDAQEKGRSSDEREVWLERIDDHLRSIRQCIVAVTVLSAIAAAGVVILAIIFLYLFLRTPPALF